MGLDPNVGRCFSIPVLVIQPNRAKKTPTPLVQESSWMHPTFKSTPRYIWSKEDIPSNPYPQRGSFQHPKWFPRNPAKVIHSGKTRQREFGAEWTWEGLGLPKRHLRMIEMCTKGGRGLIPVPPPGQAERSNKVERIVSKMIYVIEASSDDVVCIRRYDNREEYVEDIVQRENVEPIEVWNYDETFSGNNPFDNSSTIDIDGESYADYISILKKWEECKVLYSFNECNYYSTYDNAFSSFCEMLKDDDLLDYIYNDNTWDVKSNIITYTINWFSQENEQ